MQTHDEDVTAIRALVARQFDAMCWSPQTAARWNDFKADFVPEASLYPAALESPARPIPPTLLARADEVIE